jgi:hypothetical protein
MAKKVNCTLAEAERFLLHPFPALALKSKARWCSSVRRAGACLACGRSYLGMNGGSLAAAIAEWQEDEMWERQVRRTACHCTRIQMRMPHAHAHSRRTMLW